MPKYVIFIDKEHLFKKFCSLRNKKKLDILQNCNGQIIEHAMALSLGYTSSKEHIDIWEKQVSKREFNKHAFAPNNSFLEDVLEDITLTDRKYIRNIKIVGLAFLHSLLTFLGSLLIFLILLILSPILSIITIVIPFREILKKYKKL